MLCKVEDEICETYGVRCQKGRNTGSVVVTRQSRQIDRSTVFHLAVSHEDRSCGNVPEAGSSGGCAPRAARAAGASEPVGAGMAASQAKGYGMLEVLYTGYKLTIGLMHVVTLPPSLSQGKAIYTVSLWLQRVWCSLNETESSQASGSTLKYPVGTNFRIYRTENCAGNLLEKSVGRFCRAT